MNRVTILYPKTEGASFDLDYYSTSHMPLLAERLGDHCKGWGVDKVSAARTRPSAGHSSTTWTASTAP